MSRRSKQNAKSPENEDDHDQHSNGSDGNEWRWDSTVISESNEGPSTLDNSEILEEPPIQSAWGVKLKKKDPSAKKPSEQKKPVVLVTFTQGNTSKTVIKNVDEKVRNEELAKLFDENTFRPGYDQNTYDSIKSRATDKDRILELLVNTYTCSWSKVNYTKKPLPIFGYPVYSTFNQDGVRNLQLISDVVCFDALPEELQKDLNANRYNKEDYSYTSKFGQKYNTWIPVMTEDASAVRSLFKAAITQIRCKRSDTENLSEPEFMAVVSLLNQLITDIRVRDDFSVARIKAFSQIYFTTARLIDSELEEKIKEKVKGFLYGKNSLLKLSEALVMGLFCNGKKTYETFFNSLFFFCDKQYFKYPKGHNLSTKDLAVHIQSTIQTLLTFKELYKYLMCRATEEDIKFRHRIIFRDRSVEFLKRILVLQSLDGMTFELLRSYFPDKVIISTYKAKTNSFLSCLSTE